MLVEDLIRVLQHHHPKAVLRFSTAIDVFANSDERWFSEDGIEDCFGDKAEVTICLVGVSNYKHESDEMCRIVETDNYGRDFPNESFLPVPSMSRDDAERIATLINKVAGPTSDRFWKVVGEDYKLQPGFEP